jgi:hypothetical protein
MTQRESAPLVNIFSIPISYSKFSIFYTGVLTKPDRIPAGEESSWLGFIRNEKEVLENNWYCVKQPGSNELKQGMTWMDARRSEDQFFSITAPWYDLDEMYKKYLRTSNLVERLSSILSDLILKRSVKFPS